MVTWLRRRQELSAHCAAGKKTSRVPQCTQARRHPRKRAAELVSSSCTHGSLLPIGANPVSCIARTTRRGHNRTLYVALGTDVARRLRRNSKSPSRERFPLEGAHPISGKFAVDNVTTPMGSLTTRSLSGHRQHEPCVPCFCDGGMSVHQPHQHTHTHTHTHIHTQTRP
jgi:hypothetical protein